MGNRIDPALVARADQHLTHIGASLDAVVDAAREILTTDLDRMLVIDSVYRANCAASDAHGIEGAHQILALAIVRLAEQSTPDGAL